MKNAGRYLWAVLMAQVLLLIAVLALRVHYSKLPHLPVKGTYSDIRGGIKMALEMFEKDSGRYPTAAEGWKVLCEPPANGSLTNWRGPYLAAPPKDPWGRDYVYRFPGVYNTNEYDLYSRGSDGISRSGGNDLDDINNWDEASPHGGFVLNSYYGDRQFAKAATLLLIIPFLFCMRMIAERKSPRFRAAVAGHPRVDAIWILMSLMAVCIWLSAVGPRLAER